MKEKLIRKTKMYHGSVVDLFCDEVELPNGAVATREYLDHPGAASVLPFVDDKNIVLIKQYRYPIDQITYEIPAGRIDKGEVPIECASRELVEETGYRAKELEMVLSFYPAPAFSTEIIYIFSAFGLEAGRQNQEDDEFLSSEIINFKDAVKMVKVGKIKDSKTIIALMYFANKGLG
ncbi:MAG: NUDIX hydrolase [Endomicrobium sp.]|nr:NUDIX hydrolase [Endomicrobium sp.]